MIECLAYRRFQTEYSISIYLHAPFLRVSFFSLLTDVYVSFKSIHMDRCRCVTSLFFINNCVPQGSVLTLTLFPIFINDLLNCSSIFIHSYTDNLTLHSSTSNRLLLLLRLHLVLIFFIFFLMMRIEFHSGKKCEFQL